MRRRRRSTSPIALAAPVTLALTLTACAGGGPLLHPARTLPKGEVRAALGLSGNAVVGSLANDLRNARNEAAANPLAPGAPGSDPTYARGALVAASVAPGIAPFLGARVGIGDHAEGGITYTGRGARIDMRRSFDGPNASFSIGAGVSGAFYGSQQGASIPNVDLTALHGYGADLPLLVGWESDNGLYKVWAGARAGWEHVTIEQLITEEKSVTLGLPPLGLTADRYWAGGLVGLATGFRHVHVALEVDVAYQSVRGWFNANNVKVDGLTLAPASAVWWSF
jgi:hypothetical protein